MKRNRAAKKEIERKVDKELNDGIQKRRAVIRERVRKSRAKAKQTMQIANQRQTSQVNSLSEVVAEIYSCLQTLGKAVKKVSHALPASPRKKEQY